MRPRLVMETKKQGDALIGVCPPLSTVIRPARIVRGALEIMGDTVPVRSERSEQRLIRQLGEEMRMAVGVEVRLRGMAAVRLSIDSPPFPERSWVLVFVISAGLKDLRRALRSREQRSMRRWAVRIRKM